MKRKHTIAIGIAAALTLGIATSAQAHPMGGTGPGVTGPMMQGHDTSGTQGGMGAGHHGPMAHGQTGSTGPHQHGATGKGPTAGGCPMMSMMSQPATRPDRK